MNEIRVSAKNVSDAITEASIQLGVTSSELEYEVIEKGSAGFLGIGSKQAVIRAWKKVKEESVEEIRTEVQHEKKTSSEQQTEKIKSITEPHKDVKKTEPVKKEHVKEVIKREEKLSEVQENTKEACEKFLHDVLKTMGMEVEIISSIDQDGACQTRYRKLPSEKKRDIRKSCKKHCLQSKENKETCFIGAYESL